MGKKLPLTGKKPVNLKPEKARRLIRKFHVLLKTQATATARGDSVKLNEIDNEINKLGGLQTYQLASISGQSKQRGGDSSKVLMEWLPEDHATKWSMLEVGCLQVDNACARSNRFDPHVRIDLNSQNPGILKQDFMTMKSTRKFDIISLSLVVNYVHDPATRGQMLIRAHKFLNNGGKLFFVLPRACIDNSRYCNNETIITIMAKIGFTKLEERITAKLVYWLFEKHEANSSHRNQTLPKRKVADGATMNNFAITLK